MPRYLLPCFLALLVSGCSPPPVITSPPVVTVRTAPPPVVLDLAAARKRNEGRTRAWEVQLRQQRWQQERIEKQLRARELKQRALEARAAKLPSASPPTPAPGVVPDILQFPADAPLTVVPAPPGAPPADPFAGLPRYVNDGRPPRKLANPSAPATPAVQPATAEIFITRTGQKFHLAGCRYLRRSQIPISRENAVVQGYDACSVCGP